MTTCRITDLIPVVKLKKIIIRDKVGDLTEDLNSAYSDPHLDNNISSTILNDEMQMQFHVCAEDIIFNPNVEDSTQTPGIIGAGYTSPTGTGNPVVQQYFPSLEDDNGIVSPTEALPEEIVGSILDNDLNFSQYFSDRNFTEHFCINTNIIKADRATDSTAQIISLLEY